MKQLEDAFEHFPEAIFHVYDKGEAKKQRKMGHFTFLFEKNEEAYDKIETPYLTNWKELFNE